MAKTEMKESMKIVPAGKKKCVWMEAGVVSYKLCDNNYDCPTCAYDHAMQLKVARQKEDAFFFKPTWSFPPRRLIHKDITAEGLTFPGFIPCL